MAWAFPAVAVPIVGAPGGAPGVADAEGPDDDEPYGLETVMLKVYAVPFVSPVTVILPPLDVPVKPPGFDVAVNVGVPVPCGLTVEETVTCPFPIKTIVGVDTEPGAIPGVIVLEEAETGDSTPVLEIAVTVNETACPMVSPVVNTCGELETVAVAPVLAVTRYVTVPLPIHAGAVNGTVTAPVVLLYDGVPTVGVPGCLPPLSND